MKIGVIIQARKGSTRLPGKVTMPFFNKESILEIIIKRIALTYSKSQIILATTLESNDDEVAEIGSDLGIHVYRGSENDVLNRFTEVIKKHHLDGVIRVCADNPFLDVDSFQDFLSWENKSNADYIGFGVSESHPTIKTHFGLWAEYVGASALIQASEMTHEKLYIEHVTNFIYGNPDIFKTELHVLPNNWSNDKNIRFTLDSIEDFDILQSIYVYFMEMKLEMTPQNLIEYVQSNSEISEKMRVEVARWEK